MFMAVSVFCQWLIMAAYIANLTAILTSRPVPVQVVTCIDSFASLRSPICVRNNSIQARAAPVASSFHPAWSF